MNWHEGIVNIYKHQKILTREGKEVFYLFAQWPNGWRVKEWRDDEIDRLSAPLVTGPLAYGYDLCYWLNFHECSV